MSAPPRIGRWALRASFLQAAWLGLFAVTLVLLVRWNEPLRRMAANLVPIPLAALFVVALCGLGLPLARRLAPAESGWPRRLTALALGLGLTSLLIFGLGLLDLFRAWIFLLWFGVGLVSFAIGWFRAERPKDAPSSPSWTSNPWSLGAALVLALFAAQELPFLVAPEVSKDALEYHLLLPKLFLQHGGLYPVRTVVEAGYPSLAEYNYLPILALTDDRVCKAFHFWIGVAVLLAIAQLVRAASPGSSGLLAAGLFATMPIVAIHMGWAWNDFVFTLFVLLAIGHLLRYDQTAPEARSPRDLLLAGLMAGLASWTKYTFVSFFLACLLLFLLALRRWQWRPRDLWRFFAGIALVAPFWLLQNLAFTGNPVYPFLYRIFRSPSWSPAADRFFHEALRRWEIHDWTWSTYLTFPLDLVLRPRLVDIHVGVLPLILLPLLFLAQPSRGASFLRSFLACGAVVWLVLQTEIRSILAWLAVLCVLAAIQLPKVEWRSALLRRAFVALVALAVTASFCLTLVTTHYLFEPIKFFLGLESRAQYVSRLGPSQRAFDYLATHPEARTILLVGPHAPFYLARPALFSGFADPPIAELQTRGAKSPEEIEQRLRTQGVTHVVVNLTTYEKEHRQRLYSWSPDDRQRFETFLAQRCTQVARFDDDVVLAINGP